MRLRGISFPILSAAFVLATSPVLVLPAAAADSNGSDCGWYNVNGQLVFGGTCPHDTSEDSNDAPQAPVDVGCGGGSGPAYKMDVAVC